MLYREIMAVCFQIHTEHTNTLCGQNVEFLSLNLVLCIVTTVLKTLITIGKFTESVFTFINLANNFGMEISIEKSETVTFEDKRVSSGNSQWITNVYNRCRTLTLLGCEDEEVEPLMFIGPWIILNVE